MFLFHSILRKIMTTDKCNGIVNTHFLLESWACDWRECWNEIAVYEILAVAVAFMIFPCVLRTRVILLERFIVLA
jgi:hypothetical protein